MSRHGLCSSTPRGDGNLDLNKSSRSRHYDRFMQLNPARGRKPVCLSLCLAVCLSRFMQLNPARGRKPAHGVVHGPGNRKGLCSSTPRGDGNDFMHSVAWRGPGAEVYAAQPREGTETPRRRANNRNAPAVGLCSSTPRGDGNVARIPSSMISTSIRFMQLNPARGRKLT